LPQILGTGFFVNESGLVVTNRHVVEVFGTLPRDPRSGSVAVGALVFLPSRPEGDGISMGILDVDLDDWWQMNTFRAEANWHGEILPDIGFVQIRATGTPALKFYEEPGTLRVGASIATGGFAMGELPILIHGHVTQITPLLRRGIISSVFPFNGPFPHGLTIDAMVQPGASGSPVFLEDQPIVIGMIGSVLRDQAYATLALPDGSIANIAIPLSTNVSIALPGHLLAKAAEVVQEKVVGDRAKGFPLLSSLVPNDEADHSSIDWVELPMDLEEPKPNLPPE
jgi:S1-C subfamily serine protease